MTEYNLRNAEAHFTILVNPEIETSGAAKKAAKDYIRSRTHYNMDDPLWSYEVIPQKRGYKVVAQNNNLP